MLKVAGHKRHIIAAIIEEIFQRLSHFNVMVERTMTLTKRDRTIYTMNTTTKTL